MSTKHYPEIDANPNFAKLEEGILDYWKREQVFEKSVAARPEKKADGSSNAYVFYDGPPFANGLPHYGHLLTGYVKDAIARYHTMKGARVERRFGWDCHGLPAEMGAEKELGISGRAAIAGYGIDKFNEYCRTSVMKYTQEWEYYVTRQGRWVDFKNDYKTMDKNFMESCLWAFKELYTKGLIYESMRVMPYSWAAETPVSNFETRIDNATREREDKAAYVAFKAKDKICNNDLPTYFVAWTTTPWTLPSNLALAVSKNMVYVSVISSKFGEKANYIFSEFCVNKFVELLAGEEKEFCKGDALVGKTYEPLFPYFADTPNAFRILDGSDFVTNGDGTGIVHMAPGFGEVDQKCCNDNGIETLVPVDEKGRFTSEIYDLPWLTDTVTPSHDGVCADPGMRRDDMLKLKGLTVVPDTRIPAVDVKVDPEDLEGMDPRKVEKFKEHIVKYGLANMRIIRWLDARKLLVKQEEIKHNYPHCWRTDTPLIYRAMSSWYVAINTQVEALKNRSVKEVMAANNQDIHWIPDHVQAGQMGKGIESAPDWSISRNRFWGTPIPIWKSPSGKIIVPGSIAEIEQLSGQKVTDLHRPMIDEIKIERDGETYTRIEDVFDCWFESGSMPYAQVHYPFENKQWFEENFPADFITEYIAQTRGWFYTLQVLSAALFECAPFKNCICHGVVIDEETGLKYSKRLKNYKDPKEVMDAYGADALRWMMLASPVMRGSDLGVDPEGKFIRDVVRLNIKPLWSAFNFFTLYANADGIVARYLLHPLEIAKGDFDPPQAGGGAGGEAGLPPPASGRPNPPLQRIWEGANMLDRYILAKAKLMVQTVQASLDAYDTPGATEAITAFLDVLNNWYIRRSRARFWAEEMSADKQAAYDTLFTVLDLICRAAAPLLPFTTEAIYRGLHVTPSHDGVCADPGMRRDDSVSVHVSDFPDVSGIDDARELVADMDWVRDVCNAGSAVRNKANIRNRQPLAALTLAGGALSAAWVATIIREELNVKEFRSAPTFDEFASVKLQINSQVLGKRLPAKMKEILPASKKGEWKREDGAVVIAGEKLLPEEYTILLEPKPAYKESAAPLSSNDALVVLDLTITPELEAEGRARDLVRMIQQARKDAGLNVADRISLAVDVPAAFKPVLVQYGEYIREQTLAVKLEEGSASAAQQLKQELDGEEFIIGLSKVA